MCVCVCCPKGLNTLVSYNPPSPNQRLLNFMLHTWRTVYSRGTSAMNPVKSKEAFDSPVVHAMYWTKGWLLQFYASQRGVYDPQPPGMWELWATATLPPHAKDFVQKVLWKNPPVHGRDQKRSGTDKCPNCGKIEGIQHATVDCSIFKAVSAIIQHFYGSVTWEAKEVTQRSSGVGQPKKKVVVTISSRCGNLVCQTSTLEVPM